MNNVKITDSVIYIVWAWQGIMISDVSVEDEFTVSIHLSMPSTTFVKDKTGKEYTYADLLPKVQMMSKSLAFATKVAQGINIKFTFEQREDNWTQEQGKLAVQEMTIKIIFNSPFGGVM